jgi:hypothetical protein
MAKLPIYQQQTRAKSSLATPQSFGSQIGQAMSQFGQTVSKLGQVVQKAKDAERVARRDAYYAQSSAILEGEVQKINADPEWNNHDDAYEKTIESMKKDAQTFFGNDSTSYQLWEKDFAPNVIKGGTSVQLASLKMQKVENTVRVDETIDIMAGMTANAKDDVEVKIWNQKTLDMLNNQVENGLMTEAEKLKKYDDYVDAVQGTKIRQLIRDNPTEAYTRLADGDDPLFKNMDSEKKEVWINRTIKANEMMLKKEDIELRRAERKQQQAEKEAQHELSKQAEVLAVNDELTMDWLVKNQSAMSSADFRYYSNKLNGEEELKSSNRIYASLSDRILKGEDVDDEIETAFINNEISWAYRNSLLNIKKATKGKVPTAYKMNRDYVSRTFGDDAVIDIKHAARKANALKEMDDFAFEHPDASKKTYDDKAKEILNRWMLEPAQYDFFNLPNLKYGPSIPTPQMDFGVIGKNTRDAYKNGEITEKEFNDEVKLLKQYKDAADVINNTGVTQ